MADNTKANSPGKQGCIGCLSVVFMLVVVISVTYFFMGDEKAAARKGSTISLSKVQMQFKQDDFSFENPVMQNDDFSYTGRSANRYVTIELISDGADVESLKKANLIISGSSNPSKNSDNLHYASMLVHTVMPNWNDADKWLSESINQCIKSESVVQTTVNKITLSIQFIKGIGISLSVKPI